jgi:hypothetical protein
LQKAEAVSQYTAPKKVRHYFGGIFMRKNTKRGAEFKLKVVKEKLKGSSYSGLSIMISLFF